MTIIPRPILLTLLSCTLLLTLAACGGGGSESTPAQQAQQVTVTFGLQGNAGATVGSVDLDVLLPAGFVLETGNDGQPTTAALALLATGATTAVNYTPETVAANGGIQSAIIKTDGFAGNADLLQISRTYAAGATLPTSDDFMVTVVASDLNGVVLPGIGARVSIMTQTAP